MDNNITLTLAPQHLRPLRHMCQANYESIMADPEASKEAKHIAADLYRRVMLLHNAVNAEEIAENTRAKYDRYISNGKRVTVHANAPGSPHRSTRPTTPPPRKSRWNSPQSRHNSLKKGALCVWRIHPRQA